ncbi:MAG: hypothetical protein J6A22_02815 [Bacteroidales bacterium]|nr:hypothetical protein [Bacteroidales bacterium]
MKRFLIALAAVVLTMAACTKEDVNPIVGIWKATSLSMTIEGMPPMSFDLSKGQISMEFIFNADGTGRGLVSGTLPGMEVPDDLVFTYTYADGNLSITSDGEIVQIPGVNIVDNTIMLTSDLDVDEISARLDITLVKQ